MHTGGIFEEHEPQSNEELLRKASLVTFAKIKSFASRQNNSNTDTTSKYKYFSYRTSDGVIDCSKKHFNIQLRRLNNKFKTSLH